MLGSLYISRESIFSDSREPWGKPAEASEEKMPPSKKKFESIRESASLAPHWSAWYKN